VCVMPCNLVDRYQYSQEPVAAIFSAGQAWLLVVSGQVTADNQQPRHYTPYAVITQV